MLGINLEKALVEKVNGQLNIAIHFNNGQSSIVINKNVNTPTGKLRQQTQAETYNLEGTPKEVVASAIELLNVTQILSAE